MRWPLVSLGNVLHSAKVFVDGDWVESKDQDPNGDVRLIQLADIGDGYYINKSSRFLTSDKAKELRCTFLEKGDILVARMPEPIGRACIFPGDSKVSVTVVDVCIIRTNSGENDNIWLMHCLNSPICRNQIASFATGTTRSRISRGNLTKIKIPLPSLEEQKRIAEILDRSQFLISKRQEAIAQLNILTQAIFIEMFGDPVINPKGWTIEKLGKLGTLDRGISKHRPRNAPELLGGIYPLVQTGDVANSGGYIRHYKNTYSEVGLRQSKMWKTGTLCITIAANIAKTGILTFDACFPDSIVGFLAKDFATIEFVRVWLSFIQKTLEETAPESAQKNINLGTLRDLSIPFPPLLLQKEFAQRVEAVEKLKATHRASLSELQELFASLQHRAFRGEL